MSVREGMSRLYNGETEIEFIGRWRRWFLISGVVILIGVAGLFLRGLNLGIDFKGGDQWTAPIGKASVADVRKAVEDAGLTDPTVQTVGVGGTTNVRVQAKTSKDPAKVDDAVKKATGASAVSRTQVGASWGSQISRKAIRALIFFLIIVAFHGQGVKLRVGERDYRGSHSNGPEAGRI